MNLREIARRAALPHRKVRYVIDHGVVPMLRDRGEPSGAGRQRSFDLVEAYWVAVAAHMLQGGVQRQVASDVLRWLDEIQWPIPGTPTNSKTAWVPSGRTPRNALSWCQESDVKVSLFVGDSSALRINVGKADSGWFVPKPLARLGKYVPTVVIQVNLMALLKAFGLVDEGVPDDE